MMKVSFTNDSTMFNDIAGPRNELDADGGDACTYDVVGECTPPKSSEVKATFGRVSPTVFRSQAMIVTLRPSDDYGSSPICDGLR
jgi:hypothetical protein